MIISVARLMIYIYLVDKQEKYQELSEEYRQIMQGQHGASQQVYIRGDDNECD